MADDKSIDLRIASGGAARPASAELATRGAAMRQKLLAKVPVLEYRGKSVLAALELDADSDLRGAIELDVEAFLTPLELTTRRR